MSKKPTYSLYSAPIDDFVQDPVGCKLAETEYRGMSEFDAYYKRIQLMAEDKSIYIVMRKDA